MSDTGVPRAPFPSAAWTISVSAMTCSAHRGGGGIGRHGPAHRSNLVSVWLGGGPPYRVAHTAPGTNIWTAPGCVKQMNPLPRRSLAPMEAGSHQAVTGFGSGQLRGGLLLLDLALLAAYLTMLYARESPQPLDGATLTCLDTLAAVRVPPCAGGPCADRPASGIRSRAPGGFFANEAGRGPGEPPP